MSKFGDKICAWKFDERFPSASSLPPPGPLLQHVRKKKRRKREGRTQHPSKRKPPMQLRTAWPANMPGPNPDFSKQSVERQDDVERTQRLNEILHDAALATNLASAATLRNDPCMTISTHVTRQCEALSREDQTLQEESNKEAPLNLEEPISPRQHAFITSPRGNLVKLQSPGPVTKSPDQETDAHYLSEPANVSPALSFVSTSSWGGSGELSAQENSSTSFEVQEFVQQDDHVALFTSPQEAEDTLGFDSQDKPGEEWQKGTIHFVARDGESLRQIVEQMKDVGYKIDHVQRVNEPRKSQTMQQVTLDQPLKHGTVVTLALDANPPHVPTLPQVPWSLGCGPVKRTKGLKSTTAVAMGKEGVESRRGRRRKEERPSSESAEEGLDMKAAQQCLAKAQANNFGSTLSERSHHAVHQESQAVISVCVSLCRLSLSVPPSPPPLSVCVCVASARAHACHNAWNKVK